MDPIDKAALALKSIEDPTHVANFRAHGKEFFFSDNSLYCFPSTSPLRKRIVWFVTSKWFETFVLCLIVLNSIVLGIADFSKVDPDTYEPDPAKSWRNRLLFTSDIVFAVFFTLECILKILAMGFVVDPGCYLRDPWNVLDFVVVVGGLLNFIPGVPSVGVLRALRVLRPLRGLTVVPRLRVQVASLLASIPELLNVVALLAFVFFIFGILGVQLWPGVQHRRCRLTERPVHIASGDADAHLAMMRLYASGDEAAIEYAETLKSNRTLFPFCSFDGAGQRLIPVDDGKWTKSSSPWSTARPCVWPIATNDTRTCNVDDSPGTHQCLSWQTCGSNFDPLGNPRFENAAIMESGTFIADLNWGFTNFDSIFSAFLTIFQCITMEGWVDVMYQIMDAYFGIAGALYFVVLIVFGSFFLLNLTLAVISDNFDSTQAELATERAAEAAAKAAEEARLPVAKANPSLGQMRQEQEAAEAASAPWLDIAPVRACRFLVLHPVFEAFIVVLILVNTVTLAMDSYPVNPQRDTALEVVNFILTIMFAVEMLIKLTGLGPREYAADYFNLFDACIVIVSFVEIAITPPALKEYDPNESGGAISALRTFRLFRLFKLARSWTSLQFLLSTLAKTLFDVANFAVLLLLFMYIYSLIGMQFFANRFRFDPDTGKAVSLSDPAFESADLPRAHFDNLLWAFVTIFQILTGENWNTVMYDGWRSVGWSATLYFVSCVVVGDFIMLNLFVAILLANFEGDGAAEISQPMADSPKLATIVHSLRTLRVSSRSGSTLGDFGGGGAGGARRGSISSTGPAADTDAHARLRSQLDEENGFGAVGASAEEKTGPVRGALHAHGAVLHESDQERAAVAARRGAGPDEGQAADSPSSSGRRRLHQSLPPAVPVSSPAHGHGERKGDVDGRGSPGHLPGALPGADAGAGAPPRRPAPADAAAGGALPVGHHADNRQGQGGNGGSRPSSASGTRTLSLLGRGRRVAPVAPMRQAPSNAKGGGEVAAFVGDRAEGGGEQVDTGAGALPRADAPSVPETEPVIPDVYKRQPLHGRALMVFGPANPIRRAASTVAQSSTFDMFILALIVVSSVLLALDNPLLNPESDLAKFLSVADVVLTVAFVVEMVLKVVTFGFVFQRDSYLRSPWNVLDFAIVILSVLSLFATDTPAFKALRAFRTFRAFRPLRVISRNPGLRLVVNALFRSVPPILNVLLVCLLFYLIFAIMGISYFKGRFSACSGPAFEALLPNQTALVVEPVPFTALSAGQRAWANGTYSGATSRAVCLWLGADWEPTVPQSFNNILTAMSALFEMSTTEGWLEIMYAGVDARGVDMQPVRDSTPGWVFFFITFLVIGSFFMLNLFVGVVVDTFNRMKDEIGGSVFLTETQREWVRLQETMMRVRPMRRLPRPGGLRGQVFDFVRWRYFEYGIMACIGLNTVVMAVNHFGEPLWVTEGTMVINYIFALIFTLEAVLKLVALGVRAYFADSWNVFDFAIVVGTDAGLVIQWTTGVSVGTIATVVRTFRVGRIFRLVNRAKSLRMLFNTLFLTLPGLANIGGLLALLLFIFAIMGVQLFATVQLGDSLNANANFQSFWTATLTLVRASTGENWNGIMYDLLARPPGCDPDRDYDPNMCGFTDREGCVPLNGCGSPAAYAYMFVFTLLVSFVMLNVFIAVILEGFSTSSDAEEARLSETQLVEFTQSWTEFDTDATLFMPVTALEDFFQALAAPMGFGSDYKASRHELQGLISSMQLPTYKATDGSATVFFTDVAIACAKRVMQEVAQKRGDTLDLPDGHEVNSEWQRRFGDIRDKNATGRNEYTIDKVFGATTIETTWRAYKFRLLVQRGERELEAKAQAAPGDER